MLEESIDVTKHNVVCPADGKEISIPILKEVDSDLCEKYNNMMESQRKKQLL
jgi:hypothetical protein